MFLEEQLVFEHVYTSKLFMVPQVWQYHGCWYFNLKSLPDFLPTMENMFVVNEDLPLSKDGVEPNASGALFFVLFPTESNFWIGLLNFPDGVNGVKLKLHLPLWFVDFLTFEDVALKWLECSPKVNPPLGAAEVLSNFIFYL